MPKGAVLVIGGPAPAGDEGDEPGLDASAAKVSAMKAFAKAMAAGNYEAMASAFAAAYDACASGHEDY